MNEAQLERMRFGEGFIAALDQSGGSTRQSLAAYGIPETAYATDEAMFALMHQMRSRVITSPSFDAERILAVILFEDTMNRQIDDLGSAEYCWTRKHVVPFLKVDKGLAPVAHDVQVMNPIPDLEGLLARGVGHGIFGTKARSFIRLANAYGIAEVVDQQFELGRRVLAAGLVPILEPEVDIHSPQKTEAEALLKDALVEHLERLGTDEQVMIKLTLPEVDDFYADLVKHPKVIRVVALSGGYHRLEAIARLARNHGIIASFSRALTEGLSAQLPDTDFDRVLDASSSAIYAASIT